MLTIMFLIVVLIGVNICFSWILARQPLITRASSRNSSPLVPYFPFEGRKDHMWVDIYNAMARQHRSIFISQYIDSRAANTLIASLIYLQSSDSIDRSNDPITLYFNCPGAEPVSGLAVADVMKQITCPLRTVNIGHTVGLASVLVALGTPGERYASANSYLSICELQGEVEGQAADIRLHCSEVIKNNNRALSILASATGQSPSSLRSASKRPLPLSAEDSQKVGLIDKVLSGQKMPGQAYERGSFAKETINFGHFAESMYVDKPDDS